MNCSGLTGSGNAKTSLKHLADGDGFFETVQLLCRLFVGRTQGPHFGGFGRVGKQGLLRRFLLIVEQLGVDIKGSGSGQRRATFAR